MKSVMLGLAAIAIAATAIPASAHIHWKSCHTYMEGRSHDRKKVLVVAWNERLKQPLTWEQRHWVRKIGSRCESVWRNPRKSCNGGAAHTEGVVFENWTHGEFAANCKTGEHAQAMSAPVSFREKIKKR